MLILSREKDQTIMIGDDIEVMVTEIRSDRVGIGIRAPRSLPIHRKEIWDKIQEEGIDLKNPYAVDATHTDPGEKTTSMALKYRQRARAAEEALEKLAFLGNGEFYGYSDGNMIARDALKKIQEIK